MSARLDIIAPHLLSCLLQAEPAPLLARLLARADATLPTYTDVDTTVLRWFGLEDCTGVGAITAAVDFDAPDAAVHWLRADPVHLRADATRVVLFDVEAVGLANDESDALLAHLNAGLADDDLHFERGSAPTRWYVRLAAPQSLGLASPRALRGRTVEDSLDALRRSGVLRRLMTEAQMLLYEAPTNLARAARGNAPINSVWFWGAGVPASLRARLGSVVLGDDDLLAACARHAGMVYGRDVAALELFLQTQPGDVLVLDHLDAEKVDLSRFERDILMPGWRALRRGRLSQMLIHGHGLALVFTPAACWRLWRRGQQFLAAARARLSADSEI
jgi:hypothetical protein